MGGPTALVKFEEWAGFWVRKVVQIGLTLVFYIPQGPSAVTLQVLSLNRDCSPHDPNVQVMWIESA